MPAPVLVAVPDLLLQSRITDAARRVGARCVLAGSPEEVVALARQERPALVLLDLESPRVQAVRALTALREAGIDAPTLGFYGHVQAQVAARAKEAGLQEAVTRGAFVQGLDALLARYA